MAIRLEFQADSKQARSELHKLNHSVGSIHQNTAAATRAFHRLAVGIAALASAAIAFKSVAAASDTYLELGNRIALVTGRTKDLLLVQKQIFKINKETRSDLEGTAAIFSRIALSTKSSYVESLALTKALNQAIKISGGSSESGRQALIQLSQGLASGVLRGEELNSVLEAGPRIAQAIADEIGVGIGQLRELGAEGKITADIIKKGLLNQAGQLSKEFALLEPTATEGFKRIGEAWKGLVRTVLRASGFNLILGKKLVEFSDAIETFAKKLEIPLSILITKVVILGVKLELAMQRAYYVTIGFLGRLFDEIKRRTGGLDGVLNVLKSWANAVEGIFKRLYIAIIGGSWWTDTIDEINDKTKEISESQSIFTAFSKGVAKTFIAMEILTKRVYGGTINLTSRLLERFIQVQQSVSGFVEGLTNLSTANSQIIGTFIVSLSSAILSRAAIAAVELMATAIRERIFPAIRAIYSRFLFSPIGNALVESFGTIGVILRQSIVKLGGVLGLLLRVTSGLTIFGALFANSIAKLLIGQTLLALFKDVFVKSLRFAFFAVVGAYLAGFDLNKIIRTRDTIKEDGTFKRVFDVIATELTGNVEALIAAIGFLTLTLSGGERGLLGSLRAVATGVATLGNRTGYVSGLNYGQAPIVRAQLDPRLGELQQLAAEQEAFSGARKATAAEISRTENRIAAITSQLKRDKNRIDSLRTLGPLDQEVDARYRADRLSGANELRELRGNLVGRAGQPGLRRTFDSAGQELETRRSRSQVLTKEIRPLQSQIDALQSISTGIVENIRVGFIKTGATLGSVAGTFFGYIAGEAFADAVGLKGGAAIAAALGVSLVSQSFLGAIGGFVAGAIATALTSDPVNLAKIFGNSFFGLLGRGIGGLVGYKVASEFGKTVGLTAGQELVITLTSVAIGQSIGKAIFSTLFGGALLAAFSRFGIATAFGAAGAAAFNKWLRPEWEKNQYSAAYIFASEVVAFLAAASIGLTFAKSILSGLGKLPAILLKTAGIFIAGISKGFLNLSIWLAVVVIPNLLSLIYRGILVIIPLIGTLITTLGAGLRLLFTGIWAMVTAMVAFISTALPVVFNLIAASWPLLLLAGLAYVVYKFATDKNWQEAATNFYNKIKDGLSDFIEYFIVQWVPAVIDGWKSSIEDLGVWIGDAFIRGWQALKGYIAFDNLSPDWLTGMGDAIADAAAKLGFNDGRNENYVPPKQETYATGGYVRGPGTGTSDSINARLSNGEYVVNAQATKSNLGLLTAINNGVAAPVALPAFRDGGQFLNNGITPAAQVQPTSSRRAAFTDFSSVDDKKIRELLDDYVREATDVSLKLIGTTPEFSAIPFSENSSSEMQWIPNTGVFTIRAPDIENLSGDDLRLAASSIFHEYGHVKEQAEEIHQSLLAKGFAQRPLVTSPDYPAALDAYLGGGNKFLDDMLEGPIDAEYLANSDVLKFLKRKNVDDRVLSEALLRNLLVDLWQGTDRSWYDAEAARRFITRDPLISAIQSVRSQRRQSAELTTFPSGRLSPDSGRKFNIAPREEVNQVSESLQKQFPEWKYFVNLGANNNLLYDENIDRIFKEVILPNYASDPKYKWDIGSEGRAYNYQGFQTREEEFAERTKAYLRELQGSISTISLSSMDDAEFEVELARFFSDKDQLSFLKMLRDFETGGSEGGDLLVYKKSGDYLRELNKWLINNNAFDLWKPSASRKMPEMATGGKIRGPGTGRSDSILARISNGEYIVNAQAAAKNIGLLDSINYGGAIPAAMPAFRTGGLNGQAPGNNTIQTPTTASSSEPVVVELSPEERQIQEARDREIAADIERQVQAALGGIGGSDPATTTTPSDPAAGDVTDQLAPPDSFLAVLGNLAQRFIETVFSFFNELFAWLAPKVETLGGVISETAKNIDPTAIANKAGGLFDTLTAITKGAFGGDFGPLKKALGPIGKLFGFGGEEPQKIVPTSDPRTLQQKIISELRALNINNKVQEADPDALSSPLGAAPVINVIGFEKTFDKFSREELTQIVDLINVIDSAEKTAQQQLEQTGKVSAQLELRIETNTDQLMKLIDEKTDQLLDVSRGILSRISDASRKAGVSATEKISGGASDLFKELLKGNNAVDALKNFGQLWADTILSTFAEGLTRGIFTLSEGFIEKLLANMFSIVSQGGEDVGAIASKAAKGSSIGGWLNDFFSTAPEKKEDPLAAKKQSPFTGSQFDLTKGAKTATSLVLPGAAGVDIKAPLGTPNFSPFEKGGLLKGLEDPTLSNEQCGCFSDALENTLPTAEGATGEGGGFFSRLFGTKEATTPATPTVGTVLGAEAAPGQPPAPAEGAVATMGNLFTTFTQDIGNIFSSLPDLLSSGLDFLVSGLGGLLDGLFGGGGAGGGLGGMLSSIFSSGGGGAAGGGGGWAGMLASAFAGSFANGGIIPTGKFGIVGERGAEIVTGPARVTSAAATAAAMYGSGGNTANVTFALEGAFDERAERTIRKMIAAGDLQNALNATNYTRGGSREIFRRG
jgi:tape measure domain-containing protein